ncbi:hypothetical protein [Streptomyces sp. NPDC056480]|uniref:hypothetical protein n=1 Tax=Streptomyces sp. NPDC056480 TaxID=3345833 RepID=UPI00368D9650
MLLADPGGGHGKQHCRLVWAQGSKPVTARHGVAHVSGPGVHRWAVEPTITRPPRLPLHPLASRRGSEALQPGRRCTAGQQPHVLVDGQGIQPAVLLTGGNRNGVTQLMPLLRKILPVTGLARRPDR